MGGKRGLHWGRNHNISTCFRTLDLASAGKCRLLSYTVFILHLWSLWDASEINQCSFIGHWTYIWPSSGIYQPGPSCFCISIDWRQVGKSNSEVHKRLVDIGPYFYFIMFLLDTGLFYINQVGGRYDWLIIYNLVISLFIEQNTCIGDNADV